MTQTLIYTPTDPAGVQSVSRLRLYPTAEQVEPPTVDVNAPDALTDGSWQFTFPDPPAGTYYASVTVHYVGGVVADDTNDVLTLPPLVPAAGSAPLAPWVAGSDIDGDASTTQKAAAAAYATDVLYGLSGRRWPGVRSDRLQLRPTLEGLHLPFPSSFTLWTPGRTRGCLCHSSHLDPQLPGPITHVVRLTVGSTEVPSDQIEVTDRRIIRVVRGANATTDPLAVNLWVDENGYYSLWPGAVSDCVNRAPVDLVVEWGTPPPEAGAAAALFLATEVAKALAGDTNCRIAGNVTSINRQGVSVLIDPANFLDKGRTGVPLVDLWLESVNPNKLQRPPEVWWPESDLPARLG